jgi:hypothetical protein
VLESSGSGLGPVVGSLNSIIGYINIKDISLKKSKFEFSPR